MDCRPTRKLTLAPRITPALSPYVYFGRAIVTVRISLGENRASLELTLSEWVGDFSSAKAIPWFPSSRPLGSGPLLNPSREMTCQSHHSVSAQLKCRSVSALEQRHLLENTWNPGIAQATC